MHTIDHHDPMGPTAAPAALRDALARIEADERLDRVGSVLAGVGRRLNASPAGPFLRGEVDGHSPHATIAMVRIGVLGSSVVAGVMGGRAGQKVAGRLATIGVAMSIPAAATAAVELDRAADDPRVRRVGALYALMSATTGLVFFRSVLSRARGNGFRGVLWSLLGVAPAVVSGYLGAHLLATTSFGAGPRGLDAPIRTVPPENTAPPENAAPENTAPENTVETTPHATIRAL